MKSRIITQTEGKIIDTIHSFAFEVTRRCNLNCDFCARGQAQNLDITHEIIDKALDEINGIYVYGIRLTGGEPFLAEEPIEYIVNEIIRRKIHVDSVDIFTNGTIRSKRVAAALKKIADYILSNRSVLRDNRLFNEMNTFFNYSGAEYKAVAVYVSTTGHDTTEQQVNDTIDFYKAEVNDEKNVAILNQSKSFKFDTQPITIDGNAFKNFDKLFGNVVPSGTSINDNYYSNPKNQQDTKHDLNQPMQSDG